MIRILQVVSSLKKNGTETFIMNLFRKIDRRKIMFDFLIFNDDKDGYYAEAASLGSRIYYITPRKEGFFKYHADLDKFFRLHARDYTAIHKHDMSLSSIAPLFYAKKYGIEKRIMHMHGSNCSGLHNKLFHKINKYRLPGIVTDVLGCSEVANHWGYSQTLLLNVSKIIANGIDLNKYEFNPEERERIRNLYNIKESDLVLLHVGSLNEVKNHKFLIEIFSHLKNIKTSSKLFCIGTGKLLENLKNQAKTLGLKDHVIFLGHRDDVAAWMSASDILVFPSLHEGLPFVLIEAQSSHLPVVASSGVPLEAKVSDNYYCLDLKAGPKVWAEKIAILNKADRSKTSNPMIRKFDIETTVKQITEIYS